MIKLVNKTLGKVLSLPTDLSEIDNEYFEEILSGYTVPEYYCVVALIQKAKLNYILNANKSKTEANGVTIPVLAKLRNKEDIDGKIGDKVIAPMTTLTVTGVHLNIPQNILSVNSVINFCNSDLELYNSITSYSIYKSENSEKGIIKRDNVPNNYFVEFKVVPVKDIIGTLDMEIKPICKYINAISAAN